MIDFFNINKGGGSGGGDGSSLNVFAQLTEPDIKKGIWLQAEKNIENIVADEDVFISGEWVTDGIYNPIPISFSSGRAIDIGNQIFLFTGIQTYKYDILTNVYTQLNNGNHSIDDASAICKVGTDIYLFGGNNSTNKYSKYDTLTNTWTSLENTTSIPFTCKACPATAVGNNIYIFRGDYGNNIYKYDTLTNTWTDLQINTTHNTAWGSAVTIGTNAYAIGGRYSSTNYPYIHKLDTLTNTVSRLNTSIPSNNFYQGAATTAGSKIYVLGGLATPNNAYEYDIIENTWTQLTNIPYGLSKSSAVCLNNKLVLLGGNSSNKVQVYTFESSTYNNNTLVISQGKYNTAGFEIELFDNIKCTVTPKYAFLDAWFYTTNNGLETDIPTYYGDGTQWINIKNPPANNVEEEDI